MSLPHYRPSGRVPACALPLLVLAALATLPAAWAYAWLTLRLPLLARPLAAVGFGAWLGYMACLVATRARVRNPLWMGRFGLFIGLAGWYVQWAAWMAISIHDAPEPDEAPLGYIFAALLAEPATLASVLAGMAESGPWTLRGEAVAGLVTASCWLAELGFFVTFPRALGRGRAREPFCEASGTRARRLEAPRRYARVDAPASVAAVRGKGKIGSPETPVVRHLRLPGVDADALLREPTQAFPARPAAKPEGGDAPLPPGCEAAFGATQRRRRS